MKTRTVKVEGLRRGGNGKGKGKGKGKESTGKEEKKVAKIKMIKKRPKVKEGKGKER